MTNERKNQLIESLRELMSSVTVLPHELDKPGRLQESIDKLTAAVDIAEDLLAIGVDDDEIEERISPAFIFNCRAVVYGFAGRIEDAIADRTRVIEIMDSRIAAGLTVKQETMANILSILADQHMKVGSKAEAYTCIQRAIEIYEKLKYISKYEGRTINGQVHYLILNCIREFEKENGPITEDDLK